MAYSSFDTDVSRYFVCFHRKQERHSFFVKHLSSLEISFIIYIYLRYSTYALSGRREPSSIHKIVLSHPWAVDVERPVLCVHINKYI